MILVDPLFDPPGASPFKGKSCHMVSDTSFSELHAFAQKIGMKRHWFQGDHYDLAPSMRERAIAAGAAVVTAQQLVARMIGRRRSRR